MARQANIYRQLAVAEALAEGVSDKEIARRFAQEWKLTRESIRNMIKKLLRTWAQAPMKYSSNSLSPWKTSPKARERMNVLREALASGQARGDVVRKYAERWELSTEWVDELITRVIVESRDEIQAQAQRELAMYIARIRASLTRYAETQDHPSTCKAYERLTLLGPRTGS